MSITISLFYLSVDASDEHEDYMASIVATYGRCRVIKRCSIFEDMIESYQ